MDKNLLGEQNINNFKVSPYRLFITKKNRQVEKFDGFHLNQVIDI